MKVLIIDDEKHVREGIRLLGEWEQNGITEIYEGGNGEEAIALIQTYKPEIIFSDMKMPKMDGTRLLEWIKENQPSAKTIVVTGFDDYHYMRKAIHSGSLDYLLKPIDPEILNQTLEKAVSEWKKEEADRKQKESSAQIINEMKPVYQDRQLTQLLYGDMVRKDLYEEIGFFRAENYLTALVSVSDKILGEFSDELDLAYFTILNIINEIVKEKKCGIGFRNTSTSGEIVIIFWSEFTQIEKISMQIYQTIKKLLGVSCPIAIGKMVDDISKLKESYQHAISGQTDPKIIYEIEKYLLANFNRDVKLQEISTHFYLSREYISRKFKQEFNVNISDYIVNIRISKAKSLLKNSQLKIYEVANMIGYQDDKYFRKVFKKVEGITPNEYRALHA